MTCSIAWLPFLLILLIAAVLRLIALPAMPPGLQHDEVFHGHDAVTVLLGNHPLYFTSNAGNEPLFIYLMSLTIGLFGHNAWGIRLAAVICGLLTVLFTYCGFAAPTTIAPPSWRRRCWRSTSGRYS